LSGSSKGRKPSVRPPNAHTAGLILSGSLQQHDGLRCCAFDAYNQLVAEGGAKMCRRLRKRACPSAASE
jgi:hypothetical protein